MLLLQFKIKKPHEMYSWIHYASNSNYIGILETLHWWHGMVRSLHFNMIFLLQRANIVTYFDRFHWFKNINQIEIQYLLDLYNVIFDPMSQKHPTSSHFIISEVTWQTTNWYWRTYKIFMYNFYSICIVWHWTSGGIESSVSSILNSEDFKIYLANNKGVHIEQWNP